MLVAQEDPGSIPALRIQLCFSSRVYRKVVRKFLRSFPVKKSSESAHLDVLLEVTIDLNKRSMEQNTNKIEQGNFCDKMV